MTRKHFSTDTAAGIPVQWNPGGRTACAGCEQTEADRRKIERRPIVKAQNAISWHARRAEMPRQEFARRYGWDVERMAYDIEHGHANTCCYCWQPYRSMDGGLSVVTLDIVDPEAEPYYRTNTRWCCHTCNTQKQRMAPALWDRRCGAWAQWRANQTRQRDQGTLFALAVRAGLAGPPFQNPHAGLVPRGLTPRAARALPPPAWRVKPGGGPASLVGSRDDKISGLIALTGLALLATAGPALAHDGEGNHHCRRGQVVTIIGTGGPDVLVGGECPAFIYGLGSADLLIAGNGGDHLFGGRGDDRLRSINGYPDVVSGGRGFDRCRGDQLDVFKSCERVVRFFVQPAH